MSGCICINLWGECKGHSNSIMGYKWEGLVGE